MDALVRRRVADQVWSAHAGVPLPLAKPNERTPYHRQRLLDLPAGIVEDLRCVGESRRASEGYCESFQVCLPYRGLFVWHVGGEEVVGDPNQVIFVRRDEAFRVSSPLAAGYAELVITPSYESLAEIADVNGHGFQHHPLFRTRARPVDARLKQFSARFVHRLTRRMLTDPLQAEEALLTLLKCAFHGEGPAVRVNATTSRLIRRAKEFLQLSYRERVLLADVSRAVGASPAYLTDLFSRVEGMALHEYLTQLRLSRALLELPHTGNLTELALDVGFSSHSHFTYAFRRRFGCTPSEFRRSVARSPHGMRFRAARQR